MTTIYVPPAATPAPYGLYSAATVLEVPDPTRLAYGILVRNINCGPADVWPIDCAADISELSKTGDRTPDETFDSGLVAYSVDSCGGLLGDSDEQRSRAENVLRLQERVKVENHVAAELAARAPVPVAATSLVDALSKLDDLIAPFGFTGVIHARPGLVNEATSMHLAEKVGTALKTPSGHTWAFGAGYTVFAANTLYATGPVVIHRGPVAAQDGLDVQHNDRLWVAEREAAFAWECFTFSIEIV